MNTAKNKADKVDVNEFLKITKWSLGIIFKVHPIYFSVYIATSILRQWQDLIYTYIFAKAVDELIRVAQMPEASVTYLYPYLLIILAYNLIQTLISFFNSYSWTHLRIMSNYQVRKLEYYKLNSLGIQTLEMPEINNTITRTNEYINGLLPYTDGAVNFIASLVKLATTVALTFKFMPYFAPFILLASIPYLLFDKSIRRKMYQFDYNTTEERRIGGNISADLTSSVRLNEIIINNAFRFLDRKFSEIQEFIIKNRLSIAKKGRVGGHSFGFLNDIVILVGYVQIFKRLIIRTISVGDTVFWMRTLNIFQSSITSVIKEFNDLFEFSLQLKEAYKLFDTSPVFEDGKTKLPMLSKGPKIEFKNISFTYPNAEKPVIENLNLEINAGEKVAIVGQNGAGKTTLLKLLSRFYKVSDGKILINNINLNDLEIDTLYQNMGVLFQEFNTYPHLTVTDNIFLGDPKKNIDIEQIKIAAEAADAASFINQYKYKYDQILSEKFKGGVRPSSGQWQKIALARFFYRNSPLVVFDEPTATIDPVSEYNIFNKIYEFFKNKTVIIVSHRFSTVRNADRIIVLENGQIIEMGKHDELMAQDGYYAKAFNLQAQGYAN